MFNGYEKQGAAFYAGMDLRKKFLRGNALAKIAGNRLFALLSLVGFGIWLLIIPAFTGGLGANPLESLLHGSGEISIWTLGFVLALSPLRTLFPRSSLVTALNRHRRMIG